MPSLTRWPLTKYRLTCLTWLRWIGPNAASLSLKLGSVVSCIERAGCPSCSVQASEAALARLLVFLLITSRRADAEVREIESDPSTTDPPAASASAASLHVCGANIVTYAALSSWSMVITSLPDSRGCIGTEASEGLAASRCLCAECPATLSALTPSHAVTSFAALVSRHIKRLR